MLQNVSRQAALVIIVAFLCHVAQHAYGLGGMGCTSGGGGATTCVTVATGCSAPTDGQECDWSGYLPDWCQCDRNWSVGNVFTCGCDWLF